MFDILMYLFEFYMDNNTVLEQEEAIVFDELENVGFTSIEISRALSWLNGLNVCQNEMTHAKFTCPRAFRQFTLEECEAISSEGRGYLFYLEQIDILDPVTREIVIDRLMALEQLDVDLGRVKWVILIALFNQPDKKSALNLLQNMVIAEEVTVLH